jgi:nucleotide-binding universal stress UspA family protein
MSFATGLKTIVVATDLHGQSEAALEYARKLALNYGARIVLAHGADPLDYAAVMGLPGQVHSALPEEARAALDKLANDLLCEGIHSHTEVRQGAVAQMLVDVARQYQAGLIVMGTKGMQGAGPIVVGAIAEKLVRLAPCPVLAVAADWNAGQFRPTPGGPVLLAMERNEATAEAVATAHSLAQVFKRPLIAVHARAAEGSLEGSEACAAQLEEFGVFGTDEVPVSCIGEAGEPVDAVVRAIATYHPSILVAGVKRTSETPGPHGTAFALLARSRVPVLCVPPAGAAGEPEREVAVPAEAI